MLDMSAAGDQSTDLDSAVASFRAGGGEESSEVLSLPTWQDQDWKQLFRLSTIRRLASGDTLIRHGEPDRTIYFVLRGTLEVFVRSGNGISMGRVALVGPGSVLGEMAFFDGGPRSASAWAVGDSDVAAMTHDQYAAFERTSPALARDLIFALGRVLASRLRKTNARIASSY